MKTEPGEVFLPVEGAPSYLVSNRGRVFSSPRKGVRTGRFLKPSRHKDSYYYTVRVGGKHISLHTLVGRHFLPHTGAGLICHKQENLSVSEINCVENLWVGTPSDNISDAFRKGRKTSNFIAYNKSDKKKEDSRTCGFTGKTHSEEVRERIRQAKLLYWADKRKEKQTDFTSES